MGTAGAKRKKKRAPSVAAAFRVDASRRLARVLAIGAALVLLGALFSAGGMVVAHRRLGLGSSHLRTVTDSLGNVLPGPSWIELWPGVVGLLLVVSGALFTLVALRRVLDEEAYLALRSDGALFVRGGERRLLRWRDVEDVRALEGRVVFVLHDGDETEVDAVFSGRSIDDVVKVARDVRRKALFGLLR